MAAVIGVLNESLTEAVKGFYRLRKAYTALQEIADAENRFIKAHHEGGGMKHSMESRLSAAPTLLANSSGYASPMRSGHPSPLPHAKSRATGEEVDDDDLDFVDADETLDEDATGDAYSGHLLSPMTDLSLDSPIPGGDKIPPGALTNPIDLFIHTGTSLCFGVLQLLLSFVPPTFSRLLAIVGFRGSRTVGMKMLLAAAEHTEHINGGIAALVVLAFYNNMVGFCDIVAPDPQHMQRSRELLTDMRTRYPKGKFWLLEEARELGAAKKPEEAIKLLKGDGTVSPLKQIEALRWMEISFNNLYIGNWEECANGFLKILDLNNWSQGLYYYIAASCYIELYREAEEPTLKEKYKTRATELINTVPTKSGKRRFMARQLPFDAFVSRKYAKWTAIAEKHGCSIIDAVGVSPAEEMVYFWNGNKRRNEQHLTAALARLDFFTGGKAASEHGEEWTADKEHDEVMVYFVLKAALLRRLGRRDEARATLLQKVESEELHTYKARISSHAETWPLPVGCYEVAVCAWDEYMIKTGHGEKEAEEELEECRKWVTKVAKWEGYDLDARMGMKVRTAQETLRKLAKDGVS